MDKEETESMNEWSYSLWHLEKNLKNCHMKHIPKILRWVKQGWKTVQIILNIETMIGTNETVQYKR